MGYLGRTPTPSPIDSSDIPANSIDASKIVDGSIELAEIADNSITDAKLNSSKLDGIETGATNYIHPTTHATADIADNAITEAKIADAAVVSLKSGRKNLIINGGFDVWQRGTSFTNTTDVAYRSDRWKHQNRQSSQSDITLLTNQDVVGTNMNVYKFTVDTPPTDSSLLINQFIEEGSFTLIGKTVTASWYARQSTGSGVTSNINFEVDGGTTFLGSANTLTSSWQRFTQTFTFSGYTAASVSDSSLRTLLYFKNTAASDVIEVTGVQLELGSVATDFEHRSYGEELALCQRYYQKVSGTFSMIGSHWGTVSFCSYHMPVTMRALPTFLVSTANAFQVFGSNSSGAPISTALALSVAGKDSCELQVTNTNTASSAFIRFTASSDWFSLDAEL